MLIRLFDEDDFRDMTPRASESKRQKAIETQRIGTLLSSNKIRSGLFSDGRSMSPQEFVKTIRCPTVTEDGNYNKKGLSESSGDGLHTFVIERLPTLHGFSKDGKSNGPSGNELGRAVNISLSVPTVTKHAAKDCNSKSELERNTPPLAALLNGSLNPEWVEWLQGFPIGWTSVESMSKRAFDEWISHPQWWRQEPEGIPRVMKGVANCSKRIAGLGNAQVPHSAELAWKILNNEIT